MWCDADTGIAIICGRTLQGFDDIDKWLGVIQKTPLSRNWISRTETAVTQAHTFLTTELAIRAQMVAEQA